MSLIYFVQNIVIFPSYICPTDANAYTNSKKAQFFIKQKSLGPNFSKDFRSDPFSQTSSYEIQKISNIYLDIG